MSRERVRTMDQPGSGTIFAAPNGSGGAADSWTASSTTPTLVKLYERIVDQNNGRLRPQSPVFHERYEVFSVPVDNWSDRTDSPYGMGFVKSLPQTDARNLRGLVSDVDSMELAVIARDKIISKYASVAKEWSLLNNLLEVGDTLELIKRLRKFSHGDLDSRPRYLDWKFGLEPLYRDLSTLYSNLVGLKARLNQLRKQSGAKRRISERIPFNPQIVHLYPGSSSGRIKITKHDVKGVARANGVITVSVPPLDGVTNNVKILLDAFGAHLDAVTVYDAIPFTWLLDWVFPFGDWLESLSDRRWVRPSVTFEKGSMSYRIDATLNISMVPDAGMPYLKEVDTGTGTIKIYNRTGFSLSFSDKIPGNFPEFKMPELTPNKLAILGGLSRLI